jgi:hypothetical protein
MCGRKLATRLQAAAPVAMTWNGMAVLPISPKSQTTRLYARGAFRAVTFESQPDRICFLLPVFARRGTKTGNMSKVLP